MSQHWRVIIIDRPNGSSSFTFKVDNAIFPSVDLKEVIIGQYFAPYGLWLDEDTIPSVWKIELNLTVIGDLLCHLTCLEIDNNKIECDSVFPSGQDFIPVFTELNVSLLAANLEVKNLGENIRFIAWDSASTEIEAMELAQAAQRSLEESQRLDELSASSFCIENGWDGLLCIDKKYWAFPPRGVMRLPVPIPGSENSIRNSHLPIRNV